MTTTIQPTDVVAAYAEAKSRADVEEALRHCAADLVVHTIPFQVVVSGKQANRVSFAGFSSVFPDYSVELDGMTGDDERLAGWGTLRATMRGPIGRVQASNRRFELPFACVWRVERDLLAEELFYFDLHQMCEQLGLDTSAVLTETRKLS